MPQYSRQQRTVESVAKALGTSKLEEQKNAIMTYW